MPPAETDYLGWLYSKVARTPRSTPTNSHYNLMRMLHTTEFVWLLSGDDNRAEDGRDLRKEFENLTGVPDRSMEECSVLEMFIALSLQLEFQTDVPTAQWFWEFMTNLELAQYNDGYWPGDQKVADILDKFVWRRFEPSGVGGAFPLDHPEQDQREVEIWYQFWAYLKDQDRLL
jgi:hypothetical protein